MGIIPLLRGIYLISSILYPSFLAVQSLALVRVLRIYLLAMKLLARTLRAWAWRGSPRVVLICGSQSISDLLVHIWGEVVAGLLGDEVEG